MALDPQPLADAAGGDAALTARALAAAVLLAGVAAAQGFEADLEAYRRAAASGAVGAVSGRAFTERRTPSDAEQPLAGTVVTLLPRSAELVGHLQEIRAHARDSERAFIAAATSMRVAREAYENWVWEAGFPELPRTTVVDATGAFSVADLPAGNWLLIGTRSVFVIRPSPRATPRDREVYRPRLRLMGYYAVSVWLQELSVAAGRTESIELSDRNVWFTGVVEDRMLDADP